MEFGAAIIEGAAVRLRPILVTAITTILGMLPMALSHTEGAELRSPMAIAVASGLLFSTFLTLFVIPIAYSIVNRVKYR
jgi:HAE1 family hydrophobic/amphiphilic exporter-1